MDILTSLGCEPTHTPQHIILIRLFIAAVLGGMIGWERGAEAGTAGLRTHILIALAAALFTTLAFEIYRLALADGSNNPDPIRAIETVTAGSPFWVPAPSSSSAAAYRG
jgi:putative Mg2+ transporter-C (MgtC) family protein